MEVGGERGEAESESVFFLKSNIKLFDFFSKTQNWCLL